MKMPRSVTICEVSLRDGLQNENRTLTARQKLSVLSFITDAGISVVEVGSFVSTRAVPQMANTAELFSIIQKSPNIEHRALVVNPKGLSLAAESGVSHINISVSASQTHQLKNAGSPLAEMLPRFAAITGEYGNRLSLSASISTSFGCSFEGAVPPGEVREVAKSLIELGVKEISLADTTGMASPRQIFTLSTEMKALFPGIKWGLHLHVRPEHLKENVLAGLEAGIDRFDSSLLGLGGCPFDGGTAGNVDTVKLAALLDELGISSGADIEKCKTAASFLYKLLIE